MKGLAFMRCLPAVLALSALAACSSYSRAYYSAHPEQARRTQEVASRGKTAAPDEGAITQAGAPAAAVPAPAAQPARVTERSEPMPTPSANEVPVAPATGSEVAATTAARRASLARTQRQLDVMLGKPNDGQTAGMFMLSNDIDLSFARLALQRSKREDVRAYATRMITDHSPVIIALQNMLGELDVTPVDDPISRDLRDYSTSKREALAALDGSTFDRAYVEHELQFQHQFLSLVDDVLVPRTADAALREQFATMRPVIEAHIAHAERLAASFPRR